eukprot:GHUV01045963.1.p1 GENE.GHUV01045963.1~~GHUV01045963.1.p1  ORF type:complete len:125 (+),score=37.57 GHUV01045963.1:62-436(+)
MPWGNHHTVAKHYTGLDCSVGTHYNAFTHEGMVGGYVVAEDDTILVTAAAAAAALLIRSAVDCPISLWKQDQYIHIHIHTTQALIRTHHTETVASFHAISAPAAPAAAAPHLSATQPQQYLTWR